VKLIESLYVAERGDSAETYQSFSVTVEDEQPRKYLKVEINHLNRWRSAKECADYLRWVASELEKMPLQPK
jgi:hypothetical protein